MPTRKLRRCWTNSTSIRKGSVGTTASSGGRAAAAVFMAVLMQVAVAQTGAPRDVSPPPAFASNEWVRNGTAPWAEERARRQAELEGYLRDTDATRAKKYGFRDGHHPALAWDWFSAHPIGYGGVPYVLLQTILSLDPATESDPHLLPLARIWKKESVIEAEKGQRRYTLDHLGVGPNPQEYVDGVARDPRERRHRLPNGFVYDPEVKAEEPGVLLKQRLEFLRKTPTLTLVRAKLRDKIHDRLHGDYADYDRDRPTFQQPPKVDAVFFSCTGCHQGRVIVGGRMDAAGNILERGRMQFMPGMPNTEVENQYFSQLLMETGFAFIKSGFGRDSITFPASKAELKLELDRERIIALFQRLLDRALDPEIVKTIYGPRPDEVRRAQVQTYRIAKEFPHYLGDLISTAMKTQYVYHQVSGRYAFNPANKLRKFAEQRVPDPIDNRIGQMDAFGVASGLVSIHTYRPGNSFILFLCRDNWQNPLFAILGVNPGPKCSPQELVNAGLAIRRTIEAWAPPVPAPVDIASLSWTGHRKLANWDGNQGASARTLASGVSATGDPLKVNVRIHEPLNPFINNLPPPPYPFTVDREKARRGMAIFYDVKDEHLKASDRCSECHRPHSNEVVPVAHLGVDENRAKVNTDVSRYALAGLVMEACRIFVANRGNDWCLPRDEQGKVYSDWAARNDDYFKDTPGRVRTGEHGYKVDMQHGIWARAPYLHNGSVPTLGQLLCPQARPQKFLRGVLFYDEALVGFEWAIRPRERYSTHETQLVKEYDTTVFGWSNSGHTFGSSLCPDLTGLDPVADRREIARRILESKAGDLIEYMKTF